MDHVMNRAKQKALKVSCGVLAMWVTSMAHAVSLTVDVYSSNAVSLGKVDFEDSQYGLLIKPQLSGLPAGLHGFHLHQNPDCGDGGMGG